MISAAEQIKKDISLVSELERRGVKLIGGGNQLKARCPFHDDKNPSFGVTVDKGLWKCHAGCGGGSVIDLIAKFDGCDPKAVITRLAGKETQATAIPVTHPKPNSAISAIYRYQDELGEVVYEVVRYSDKQFRQRHLDSNLKLVWSMEGVKRVLYHLPDVAKAQTVIVTEGEKDVDNLISLGFQATCNVGGAGKWLEGYTESLAGKDVILCGDNDKPGRDHVKLVLESIAGKVKSSRIICVPDPCKDASDYIAKFPTKEEAKKAFDALIESSPKLTKGLDIPVYSMSEMQDRYVNYVNSLKENTLDLGKWLPSLGRCIRGLVPGELVTFVADTGVGKTAILTSLAIKAYPLPTLFFELELPDSLLFERTIAAGCRMDCTAVESAFLRDKEIPEEYLKPLTHIHFCPVAGLTVAKIEQLTNSAELKTGVKPKLVLLDYVQLVTGQGSRYERMSDTAEELKTFAKRAGVILVITSQVHRKDSDDPEIFLHDAKDSGSIENSSGLVIGAWRNPDDKTRLCLKILKNTKGEAGAIIEAKFDGPQMRISP